MTNHAAAFPLEVASRVVGEESAEEENGLDREVRRVDPHGRDSLLAGQTYQLAGLSHEEAILSGEMANGHVAETSCEEKATAHEAGTFYEERGVVPEVATIASGIA